MATTSDANSSTSNLVEITSRLGDEGYGGQFGVAEGGHVICYKCGSSHPVADFDVNEIARTEGVSDPDDEAAVAALVCPSCEERGTLVLKYGPTAGADDAEVLRKL